MPNRRHNRNPVPLGMSANHTTGRYFRPIIVHDQSLWQWTRQLPIAKVCSTTRQAMLSSVSRQRQCRQSTEIMDSTLECLFQLKECPRKRAFVVVVGTVSIYDRVGPSDRGGMVIMIGDARKLITRPAEDVNVRVARYMIATVFSHLGWV